MIYSDAMHKKEYISKSLKETEVVAKDLVELISKDVQKEGRAKIVSLSGDLGSGKTALVKAVASLLKIEGDITSPTYVIQKTYQLPKHSNPTSFTQFVHIDAYRLDSSEELKAIGWEKTATDPQNIIFIEWPEKVSEVFPLKNEYTQISCVYVDENTRSYTMYHNG
jgi:tRNA threonylcarbamoyl adenosine modification protein YjeE